MECTLPEEVKVEVKVVAPILVSDVWLLHVDGVSNVGGSRAGIILTNLNDIITEKALHFHFKTSNNETEYEALLAGLRLAHKLGVQYLKALSDF